VILLSNSVSALSLSNSVSALSLSNSVSALSLSNVALLHDRACKREHIETQTMLANQTSKAIVGQSKQLLACQHGEKQVIPRNLKSEVSKEKRGGGGGKKKKKKKKNVFSKKKKKKIQKKIKKIEFSETSKNAKQVYKHTNHKHNINIPPRQPQVARASSSPPRASMAMHARHAVPRSACSKKARRIEDAIFWFVSRSDGRSSFDTKETIFCTSMTTLKSR
jgi:hypothetical protein